MTTYETKKLQRYLRSSQLEDSSKDFDDLIINQAQQFLDKEHQLSTSGSINWASGTPLLASLVIVLSFLVLFGQSLQFEMGITDHIVVVEDREQHANEIKGGEGAVYELATPNTKPSLVEPQPNSPSRDYQWQVESLPSAQELMLSIEVPMAVDREEVRQNVEIALEDIRNMLDRGSVIEAQSRYQLLIAECRKCKMPQQLELIMNRRPMGQTPRKGRIELMSLG